MTNEAGKGDKVANKYRTKQWEESKLWKKKKTKPKQEKK